MEVSLILPKKSKYGRYHNLDAYLQDLEDDYFYPQQLDLHICWGRWPREGYKNVSLGNCYPSRHLIRISPILDCKQVPRYFVKYVIFHEMLHYVTPYEEHHTDDGVYFSVHTPAFLEAEAKYKYYAKALRWEENNVHKFFRKRPK
jgi:hypothetical protein